ncbi:targeting protein for Xklp2 homolog isoform X2 [Drosophila obscura]|uniref:targeting protein for Xklp2 homolog isoform X2 n=1 Tax=Drosophila obscura TaxID=7282 RepID=UPI001BB0E3E5|nr:targeting protein for Xklp2 homolog isoform X2 [Drosophila obscura]
MDNPNIIVGNAQFDWDSINVGDLALDHSENFFAAANKENKPLNNGNLLLGTTPQAKMANSQPMMMVERDTKKIIPLSWDSDSNDVKSPTGTKEETQVEAKPPTNLKPKEELVREGEPILMPKPKTDLNPNEPEFKLNVKVEKEEVKVKAEESHEPQMGLKLRSQWSPRPHTHNHDTGTAPPKAYDFKNIYQHNREAAVRQRNEEERKARQFHSRPMPNFSAMHKRLDEVVVCHKITIPHTPETVKHWQSDLERRKRKEQEQQAQLNQVRRPLHLHDAQPSHPKPFQLRCDQRVRERREYDAAVQVTQDKKKKEQDEQRKRCEQEEIKEIRKMTVFKARPNPFK